MIRRHQTWPTEQPSTWVSRRSAITLGALGLTGGWRVTHQRGDRAGATGRAAPHGESGGALRQPQVLGSRGGRLRVDLTAAGVRRGGGQPTGALSFNGSSPGPTLRVHPGDELAVRLINRLNEPTNLHTHGLRVSPEHHSDNPFLHIHPGTSFDYRYRLPADHPTGTFWYHPHAHGMVADQVFGGLFGALLVDPPPGQGPDLATVEDRVLLISDITFDPAGRVAQPTGRTE